MKPKQVYGFKCMKCFSNVYVEYFTFRQDNGRIPSNDSGLLKRSDICSCGNCALILDLDGIVHLYCDDICTTMLCRVDTSNPSDAELLQGAKGYYYQDYSSIANSSYLFTNTVAKNKELAKPKTTLLQRTIKRKLSNEKSKTRNKT